MDRIGESKNRLWDIYITVEENIDRILFIRNDVRDVDISSWFLKNYEVYQ